VTTETGADYKVIISQDGMYKGHVEILAMWEVKVIFL
jgi:hypothetical protein